MEAKCREESYESYESFESYESLNGPQRFLWRLGRTVGQTDGWTDGLRDGQKDGWMAPESLGTI